MATRARTPLQPNPSAAVSTPDPSHLGGGNGVSATNPSLAPTADVADFAPTAGNPVEVSPLAQSLNQTHYVGKFSEDFDASQRGSSIIDTDGPHRSTSRASTNMTQSGSLSRSGTLKKKSSISRKSSLKRSGSRRSLRAGSIKGVSLQDDSASSDNHNSVFYTPVPTSGTPTDILTNRFQAWRKLLKDLIAYFREVQTSYEQRSKALLKVSNVINNTNTPPVFLTEGGLNEANRILRDYHKQAVLEANKARDIEMEVIVQLSGLRADLGSKIKEIKSLSGDFKNSVEKEKEGTRKAVAALEDALAAVDVDPSAVTGKGDPYVVRLAVERQVERQIDEENYLHRAYLNLEGSGRELESIIIGEVQKAYNALATILKRDADEAYTTVDKLRTGPIAMAKDHEWTEFVEHDPHFVNPNVPLRRLEDIEYPGKHHPAAAEVRAGMLERKSKYLKSYTPGWYVLSPTHLHEFKSADRIYSQPPVMSLYLPEQKLGTHSQPGSSSHKFVLKGRQTGSMHRGHSWVFRAESYDTMMAWYEDIKSLTEKSGEERNNFVRRHTRSISASSARSVSDSGMEEDEADQVPYSASNSLVSQEKEPPAQRPSPGGRFPSDIQVNGHLQAPLSPSSGSSEIGDHDLTTTSGGFHGHGYPTPFPGPGYTLSDNSASISPPDQISQPAYGQPELVYESQHQNPQTYLRAAPQPAPVVASEYQQQPQRMQLHQPMPLNASQLGPVPFAQQVHPVSSSHTTAPPRSDGPVRHNSTYGEWFAPVTVGISSSDRQQMYSEGKAAGEQTRRPGRDEGQQQPTKPHPLSQIPPTTQRPVVEPSLSYPNSVMTTDSNFTAVSSADGISPPFGSQSLQDSIANNSTTAAANGSAKKSAPPIYRTTTEASVGSLSDFHVPGGFPRRG